MSVITRVGRGRFVLGKSITFQPEISPKIKSLNTKLKNQFPYLKTCLWSTSIINQFMVHQPGKFYLLVEVEKEATESVFYYLKESKNNVFINPTIDILEKYLPNSNEIIIVNPLVSEAPIKRIQGVSTVSIEKLLVDVYCDAVIFAAQQGSEMRTIFTMALNKYPVNKNRMLRYADRRGQKEPLRSYLNFITF